MLTDDELLQLCRFKDDGWVVLHHLAPLVDGWGLEQYATTVDAAVRFFDLCKAETPVVRVIRVTDGQARFIGSAFKGAGNVCFLS